MEIIHEALKLVEKDGCSFMETLEASLGDYDPVELLSDVREVIYLLEEYKV